MASYMVRFCLPSFVSAEQIVDAVNNLSSTIEGDGAAFAKGRIVGFFSFSVIGLCKTIEGAKMEVTYCSCSCPSCRRGFSGSQQYCCTQTNHHSRCHTLFTASGSYISYQRSPCFCALQIFMFEQTLSAFYVKH